MSCGLPVVATRVGGIPEVVDDGVTGFLVAPASGAELAAAAGKLLDDPALLRRMGAAGRDRAHRLFGVDVHVERMLEIYAKL
jgi:starch synthase